VPITKDGCIKNGMAEMAKFGLKVKKAEDKLLKARKGKRAKKDIDLMEKRLYELKKEGVLLSKRTQQCKTKICKPSPSIITGCRTES
jgi:hypothetical protein